MTDQCYRVQTFCPPSWSITGKAARGNRWQHIPTQKSCTQPRPTGHARGPGSLHTLKSSKLRKKWKREKTEKQRKSASLTQPPKQPNKEEYNPSLVLPPDSPSATAEAEGILKAKPNEGACTPPIRVPQLPGHKQMFSQNCPAGTREKQKKSSLGGGVQQDSNPEAPTYSDSRKRAVLMILLVAST